jgi:Domain of unknown function (DUF4105)
MMRTALVLAAIVVLMAATWGSLALYFDGPGPRWLAIALAVLYGGGTLAVLIWKRPFRWALALATAGFAVVFLWWNAIPPSVQREWALDVAQVPSTERRGDLLVVHNLRNFDYRSETDFTVRYEDRTYDLSKLTGLDLFLIYWGSPAIAHTILSWQFSDGPPLAISIETRKQKGQEYSAIRGFFKQYELTYVAADERDVVRLRTNYRGEQVYLYRLTTPPATARALLLDYAATMDDLAKRPVFYNALTHNCTTTIRWHARHIGAAQRLDWRLLLNGYADELAYERGLLDTRLPFPELKARSLVNARAKAADQAPDFSRRIREGLPTPGSASSPVPGA